MRRIRQFRDGGLSERTGYHTYSYTAPSEIRIDGIRTEVWANTSGGMSQHPYLFFGTVRNGRAVGRCLATVLDNSHQDIGTERLIAPAKDAVITAHEDRLRFESLSADAGVYARLDIEPELLYGNITGIGATSMDARPGFRSGLKSITGNFVLAVGTSDAPRSNERLTNVVAFPTHWVRGFSEAGVIASVSDLEFDLSGPVGRQALHSLVRHGNAGGLTALRMVAGRPVVTSVAAHGLPIAAPRRLAPLLAILPDVRSVQIYSHRHRQRPDLATVSFVLDLEGLTVTWMLSADHTVGFTGDHEGLDALVNVDPDRLQAVDPFLTHQAVLSEPSFARAFGTSHLEACDVIAALAAAGRAGFHLPTQTFFQRDLPFSGIGETQKRLAKARQLVESSSIASRRSVFRVFEGTVSYSVRSEDGVLTCTCSFGEQTGESGVCVHVIAVKYAEAHSRRSTEVAVEPDTASVALGGGGR